MSLNTRNAQKARPVTFKHKSRKYVVVHRSFYLRLMKRAGKVQWFTLEGGKEADVVRHKDFWAALEFYSSRQDALGINPHEALPAEDLTAIVGSLDKLDFTAIEARCDAFAIDGNYPGPVSGRVSAAVEALQDGECPSCHGSWPGPDSVACNGCGFELEVDHNEA